MFAEPMPMQHLASPTWSNPQPGGHSTPGIIFSPKPSANTPGQLADFTNLLADIAALQQAHVSPAPPQLPPASSVGPSVSPLVKALPAVMNSPAVTPRHCLNSATATPVAYIVCDAAGFNSLAAPPITPTGATAAATTLHLLGAPTASGTDAVLLPSDHASLAAMSPGAASSLLNGRTLHPIQTKPGIPPSPSQKVHSLYKTELCRSFEETGTCRYGSKCQFAHGREELRYVQRHPKYKTEVCRTFATTGTCPYGTRCRFIHPISSSANANLSGSNVIDDRSPTTPATPGPDTPMGEVRLRHLSVEVGNGDSGSPACHSPTASTPGSSMVSPAPGRRLPIFTKLAEEEIIGNKQVARTVSDIAHLLNEFPDVTVTDHAKVVDQTKVRRSISDMSSVRNELKSMKAEAAVFGAVEGSFGGYF